MSFNQNSYMPYQYYQSMAPYGQQQQVTQQQFPMQQQSIGLNGKIVESQDIVKVTEIPIGGYGVYPKADLSEIYVKVWDNNLKQMRIYTYKNTDGSDSPILRDESITSQILDRVNSLEQKIDNLIKSKDLKSNSMSTESKKEVRLNAY